jgi:hypothetical protein
LAEQPQDGGAWAVISLYLAVALRSPQSGHSQRLQRQGTTMGDRDFEGETPSEGQVELS